MKIKPPMENYEKSNRVNYGVDFTPFFWWDYNELKIKYAKIKRKYTGWIKPSLNLLLSPLGISLKNSGRKLDEEDIKKISDLSIQIDSLSSYAILNERRRLNSRLVILRMDINNFLREYRK